MVIRIGEKEFKLTQEQLDNESKIIEIPFEGKIRTLEEEDAFLRNIKEESKTAGAEILVGKFREQYGFQGKKIENLIEAVKRQTLEEANIEPSKKIETLQKALQDKETALNNAIGKITEVENSFNSYKNKSSINNAINSSIPDNTILPKEDIALILKNRLIFDVAENGNVVVKNEKGEVYKNNLTADPLHPKDVIQDFFKTNNTYLKQPQGGAGGSDSSGGNSKKISLEDFIKQQQDNNISLNTPEFNKNLEEATKSGIVEV